MRTAQTSAKAVGYNDTIHETRILIVDDEKLVLETFSTLLGEQGYKVKTASEADTARKHLEEGAFDIVFMDQCLGHRKGLDLIAELSQTDQDTSFVLMTGDESTELAIEAMKKGASDFIAKPFLIGDVLKSIDYIKKKRDLIREKKEMVASLEAELQKKTEGLKEVYFLVLSSLAQAMEKKDTGTYGHSMRVRHYSLLIASALDLREEDRDSLKVAAMLHDIGKIGTSDFVLGKPGPLSEDEMLDVRSHPRKGVEILSPLRPVFEQLETILPAILYHHEHYDGSGYPAGISGEDIPLLSRIIAVADTFDAVMSNRPYRAAATHERAFRELSDHAGTQFDADIVRSFVGAFKKYNNLFGPSDLIGNTTQETPLASGGRNE